MFKSLFSNAFHAVITIVSLVLIVFIILFSNQTGQIELKVNDVSPEDIYAPRTIVDEKNTNARRKAARESVENVYIHNDSKRISAVKDISEVFERATTLREESENPYQAWKNLKAEVKLEISDDAAREIMLADDSEFSSMRKAVTIADEKMKENISDVSVALEQCADEVDTLKLSDGQKKVANELLSLVVTANMELDEAETERRKKAAEETVLNIEYKKNQIIVRKGEIVSQPQIDMLTTLGIIKGSSPISLTYTIGVLLFILICYVILMFSFSRLRKKYSVALPVSSLLGLITVAVAFYGSRFVPENFHSLLPLGILPGIVAIFAGPQTAAISNLIFSILCGIAFDANWGHTICLIIGGTISSFAFSTVKRRSHLLPSAIVSSVFYAMVFCAMSFIEASSTVSAFAALAKGFLGGFLSGLITIGSIQFFEWIFNATTPMKLSELANPENKLLKRLLVEAPGTYHHALTVANISEIAARSINADSLLTRVGAYYHDIGKIRHSLYFKENQYDSNIHDNLSPLESAQIIIGHVSSGVEIAQKYHLPKAVCDIISQHHGTTTAGYFLLRAKETGCGEDESKFTYPGPIPQTKEAAIVMLADSCEAAVRSIDEKTEAKTEAMVRRIATERVNSGQLSQCNLTFAELETVIKVITKTLGGYFHERIKYE